MLSGPWRNAAVLLTALAGLANGCGDGAAVEPSAGTRGAVDHPTPVGSGRGGAQALVPDVPRRSLVAPDVLAVIDAARAAVEREPDSGEAWLTLGMTFDAHGMDDPAEQAYVEARRLRPDDPRPAYHQARVVERSGDGDRAIPILREALALAPEHAAGHGRLGAWLLEAGDLPGARAAYARCVALDRSGLQGVLGLARVALAADDGATAAALLEPLRAADPDQGEVRFLLGTAYRALGRLDDARTELAAWDGRPAPVFDPWEGEVARHTAGYQAEMDQAMDWGRAGDAARAVVALEALHVESPDDSAVLEKLSGAYVALGRLADAERVLAEALARDPSHYRTWRSLAVVKESAGDLASAREAAVRCLALHPTWAHGHELLARLRWKSGDLPGAAASLQAALRYGGPLLSTLQKLARAQALLRRWSDARSSLEQALLLAPEDVGVMVALAEACAESGKLARAWELFDVAAVRDGRHASLPALAARLAQLDPGGAARLREHGG